MIDNNPLMNKAVRDFLAEAEEIVERLRAATSTLPAKRLWVNPDCGLKTRGYAEVNASLTNLVEAARQVRAEL